MAGRPSKHSAPEKKAIIAERQAAVLEMKKKGMTFEQIGNQLGVSAMQAHRDLKKSLERLHEMGLDRAREWRDLEVSKLERLEAKLERDLESENDKTRQGAVDRIVRIAERRSRLLGLDEPERVVHIEGRPEQMNDDDIAGEVEEILKKRQEAVTVNGNGSSNGRSE